MADRSPAASLVAGTLSGDAITVDTSQRFQTIHGLGFVLTDTSAYLIDQMPNDRGQRGALMGKLFDPDKGIGVSWVRVIMGPSDFTVVPRPWYSYRPTATVLRHQSAAHRFSERRYVTHHPYPAAGHQPVQRTTVDFAGAHSAPAWMKAE